jgi:hypothetical protein
MRFFLMLLFIAQVCCVNAQKPRIADVFKNMPDSLMPYLSANSRLDMIDFMEAGMRAEVTNLLQGDSEMTLLTADSLSIRMSDVLTLDLQLSGVAEPVDSSMFVVRMVRTYTINEHQTESIVDIYSTVWRHLSSERIVSSLLRRDEDILISQP